MTGPVRSDGAVDRQVNPMDAFESHRSRVFAWALRFVRNPHDAADLCQEVYLRWRRASRHTAVIQRPAAWLRRVTVNLAIDLVRARRREAVRPTLAGREGGVLLGAEQCELEVTIAAALAELTDVQRSVVVGKVYDGLTYARIAEELGLAIPTVKTHYLRAIRNLRPLLAAYAPENADTLEHVR